MAINKKCEECNKEFTFYPYDIKERKFCSQKCYWQAKKGTVGYWKGKKRVEITGENNNKWKGNKVGYVALHAWVRRQLGSPRFCEHCKNSKKEWYHWANISGDYKRNVKDWLRLCVKCHSKYDHETK